MNTEVIIEELPRVSVVSSQIAGVGYDPSRRIMDIEFNTGSVYRYDNVSPEVHEQMMHAPSVGSFFYANIKPLPERFPYRKIREAAPRSRT